MVIPILTEEVLVLGQTHQMMVLFTFTGMLLLEELDQLIQPMLD